MTFVDYCYTRACPSDVAVSASAPRPRTPPRRAPRTWCGPSTSSSTSTRPGVRSKSRRSWTSTPGSASAASWNAPSPPTVSPTISTTSLSCTDRPRSSEATTGPSSSARRSPTGPAPAPACRTSRPARRGSTATSSRSTPACATSA